MTTLRIKDVFKRYPNGAEAVKGVSVDVEDGELVVFVGPSGCGKSTLLRMVAGLEAITSGEIELAGRVVNELEPAERNIAMVFQNYALYPHMTVRKNLAYGLKNRGTPSSEITEKVEAAGKLLQISEYLDRKPSQLSGGQRQRVAMGRAIVRDPAIFLFDEPLSNLDAKLRNQMRLEIKNLQRRLDTAAVYVTHDQVEAMTLADRIVVLNNGLVEQIGTPAEVYSRPHSTFVASFIGAPPMNLLSAQLTDAGVKLGDQTLPIQSTHRGSVQLGLRPERIQISESGDGATMQVTIVEELGATRLVHGIVAGQDITISRDADLPVPTDQAIISFRPDDAHLFDTVTGKCL
ncbi:sn-glycerol-3-phosphate ABC transporter ATP-binding protein UgpC [Pseudopelagicola sp. nBUS_19]|uniref:sn-glycerol-3-phosphate ABC transporter ATP-binding protein UgpC n=1 Tax=unclassified Pseudopelagicola TaxID=2649563 RepID=UPI003EBD05C1